ncbi:MAG: molybdenum cofactor cytidylyltransferase [Desulfobacterales bacterium]|nr:molybdenum cofactor cytidylyltransferase [Desulfobacterales bacterium]
MRDKARIAGIILAAGKSTRMGKPKQLLLYKGRPMLANIIESALRSNLDEVIVVLGHQYEAVKKKIKLNHVNVVINHHYEKGQSTSLKAGMDTVLSLYDGVMFLLGDMPFVDDKVINNLIETYKHSEKEIIVASFHQKRGHPVLFNGSLFSELKQIAEKDEGARSILEKYPDRIEYVEFSDDRIFIDIDTQKDYENLLNRSQSRRF